MILPLALRPRTVLALILLSGLGLRVWAVFAFPGLAHPDETFQLFEPAHQIAFGYGVKTWEFYDGLRSMVIPYALAGLFRIGAALFGGPEGYIVFTRIVLALISLVPVVFIYRMGLRVSRTHALLAALVAASWFEFVYFSYRPLTEALAADATLIALSLASRPPETLTPPLLAAVGVFLAGAVMLRLQLLPGAVFAAAWLGRRHWRNRWLPMILGALPVIALFGAVDWATWGVPFGSYVQAVAVDLLRHKASLYTEQSPWRYLEFIAGTWSGLALCLLLLIWVGARRTAIWIGFAVVVISSHSLVAHKEYRFIYPAIASLVMAAAMGSADLVVDRQGRLGADQAFRPVLTASVLWIAGSLALWSFPALQFRWTNSRDLVLAEFQIGRQPDLCGLLLYDYPWSQTGGYAFLHRDAPIYPSVDHRPAGRAARGAFNYVLLKRASLADFPGFGEVGCRGGGAGSELCIARRPGPCRTTPALTPILARLRLGEHAGED